MKNEEVVPPLKSSSIYNSVETNKKFKPNQFVEGLNNINKTFVNIIQQNKGGAAGNGPKTWFTKRKDEKKEEKSGKDEKSSDNEKENKEYLSKSNEIISVNNTSDSSDESEKEEVDEVEYIKCGCNEHQGKELVNRVFNLDVDTLFKCLYENGEFLKKFWKLCKYGDIKCNEWKLVNEIEMRQLEFWIDLGTFGKPRNYEEQKIVINEPNKKFIIQSQSYSTGIMYSDYFTVNCKFCMTKCSSKTSRLFITLYLDYKKQPNFIIKSFIEKNTFNQLKECFGYMEKLLEHEQELCISKKKANPKKIKKNSNSSNEEHIPNIQNLNASTIDQVLDIEEKNKDFVSSSFKDDEINLDKNSNTVQYFKFFKWNIRMDTLIRFFILATIIIMVLNTRLYVKLNTTENIINNIKSKRINDDKLNFLKVIEPILSEPKLLEEFLSSNDKHLDKWKSFFTHSLSAVRNIESILEEWTNRLELLATNKNNEKN